MSFESCTELIFLLSIFVSGYNNKAMGDRSVKGVLTVGLACLDIINVADGFPEEDTDVR